MIRRSISVACLFLVTALLSGCREQGGETPVEIIIDPHPVGITVSGTVKGSDGRRLQGVVVSDGILCTRTNSNGEYFLPSDLESAEYIIVSTPKEYSAPVRDGFPVFWVYLKDIERNDAGTYSGVDFVLNRIAAPDRFSLLLYADPQPRKRTAGYDHFAYQSLDCCDDMYIDMKELVASKAGRKVYGIGLGDIVHNDMSLYPAYKDGMASTGVVTYSVIGNHDHDPARKTSDRDAARTFESYFGPVNYSFNIGNFHVICLDNMIMKTPEWKTEDGLTDEIWQWLQNDLAFVPKSTPLILCAHSPMLRLQHGADRVAEHSDDYRELLGQYAKVYHFAGHTHNMFNHVDTSAPALESHTLSRVTGQFWTNEYIGSNGPPRGYVILNYDDGRMEWHFKPIYCQNGVFNDSEGGNGKTPPYLYRDWDYTGVGNRAVLRSTGELLDENYQMQVFTPHSYGDDYLYANVFLWDELWNAPVFTSDGGEQSQMVRVGIKDVMHSLASKEIYDFYGTYNSVLSKPSVGYSLAEGNLKSLFRTYCPDEHGKGTVSVTDRFGNTYSSPVSW